MTSLKTEDFRGPLKKEIQKLLPLALFLLDLGVYKMTKLVLVRHGESEWNKLNLFTGWTDVELSEKDARKQRVRENF